MTRSARGTVKEANALRAQLLAEVAHRAASSSTNHTVAELFDAVLEHLEVIGREPTTPRGLPPERRTDEARGRTAPGPALAGQ